MPGGTPCRGHSLGNSGTLGAGLMLWTRTSGQVVHLQKGVQASSYEVVPNGIPA
jgi:hypothetical protein